MEEYSIRSYENDPSEINSEKAYKDVFDFPNSISIFISRSSGQNTQNLKNVHYLCQQCSLFPSISIKDNNAKIILKCDNNKHKEEIEFDTFINSIKTDNIDINKYQLCQEHNQKITKVCIVCKQNLCEKCDHQEDKHQIKRYEDLKEENEYLIKFLNNYIESYKNEHSKSNDSKMNSDKGFNEQLKLIDEKENIIVKKN